MSSNTVYYIVGYGSGVGRIFIGGAAQVYCKDIVRHKDNMVHRYHY